MPLPAVSARGGLFDLKGKFDMMMQILTQTALPETGNPELAAYLVPAVLAAVTIILKKRNKH